MRRYWLLFAQATTIMLAVLFVVYTLRPELLPVGNARSGAGVVTVYESNSGEAVKGVAAGYSAAARKVMPAVVNIFSTSVVRTLPPLFPGDPDLPDLFNYGREDQTASLGSGVIVSKDGYILTNHHVIEAADKIEVALADGRHAKGRVIGSDPETDLAVIKIDIPNAELPAITFGQSEQAHVGDIVLAVGNPFGVGETVTMGIVSGLKRSHLGLNTFENFIQTDAAINPGNSGGALVDVNGNLIGINSAIYSPSGGSLGIGFAIPVSTAKKIMEQIIQTGSVTRGWIGVAVQDLTPELAESFKLPETHGVLIQDVLRGGPADRAGVKRGDVLTMINDKALTDPTTMLEVISDIPPGKRVPLKLLRKQAEMELQITVGKRPRPRPRPRE